MTSSKMPRQEQTWCLPVCRQDGTTASSVSGVKPNLLPPRVSVRGILSRGSWDLAVFRLPPLTDVRGLRRALGQTGRGKQNNGPTAALRVDQFMGHCQCPCSLFPLPLTMPRGCPLPSHATDTPSDHDNSGFVIAHRPRRQRVGWLL